LKPDSGLGSQNKDLRYCQVVSSSLGSRSAPFALQNLLLAYRVRQRKSEIVREKARVTERESKRARGRERERERGRGRGREGEREREIERMLVELINRHHPRTSCTSSIDWTLATNLGI
jgi:hypothetical protein